MKKYLFAIIALLFAAAIPISAQTSPADTLGIEAISDTTEVIEEALDSIDYNSLHDIFEDMFYKLSPAIGISFALFGILIFRLPIILLALVLYFAYRNRKQKKELIEAMIKSGQPLPDAMLLPEMQSSEYLWRQGIKYLSIGIGIALFFWLLDSALLTGCGLFLACYGGGKMLMAKTSASKRENGGGESNVSDNNRI